MSETTFSCTPSCLEFIRQCNRLRNGPKFHPGDVVNTGRILNREGNNFFHVDKDATTGLPLRYVVDGTTEEGLVYGRLLSASKKGKSKVLNWNESIQIDSEYMDMLILDATDTFDPTAEIKEEKKKVTKIRKHNKSLCIKNDSLVDMEAIFSTWDVGKRVWIMWRHSIERPMECVIVKISKIKNNHGYGCITNYPQDQEFTCLHIEGISGDRKYKTSISIDNFRYDNDYIYITDQEPLVYNRKTE